MLFLRLENNSYASWLPLDIHNVILEFTIERITTYFNNGTLKLETQYLYNVRHGPERQVERGTVTERMYKQGVLEGRSRFYVGEVLYREETFKNNKLHGWSQTFYDNGVMRSQCYFINGAKNGMQECYYPSGKLSTNSMYVNGAKQGMEEVWYENGNIFREYLYDAGLQHGIQKQYDETGELLFARMFDHGKLVV